jgi:Secretion system C-terminal sorting domain
MKKSIIFLSGLLFCLTVSTRAQNCNFIIGKVLVSDLPAQNYTVELLDGNNHTVAYDNTNNLGYYVLDVNNIGEDDYKLIASGEAGSYAGSFQALSDLVDNKFTILEIDARRMSSLTRPKISFSLSPNPAHSELVLNFGNEKFYTIEFSNAIGKILLQTTTVKNKLIVDISGFAKGVYFVTVRDNENNFTVKRMVKL